MSIRNFGKENDWTSEPWVQISNYAECIDGELLPIDDKVKELRLEEILERIYQSMGITTDLGSERTLSSVVRRLSINKSPGIRALTDILYEAGRIRYHDESTPDLHQPLYVSDNSSIDKLLGKITYLQKERQKAYMELVTVVSEEITDRIAERRKQERRRNFGIQYSEYDPRVFAA